MAIHALWNRSQALWSRACASACFAFACSKPTLGDTLEGWWIAVSGGALGVVLAAVLIPVGALGQLGCACALAVGFFALILAFGEHVQGRWAMLPLMSSLLKAAAQHSQMAASAAARRASRSSSGHGSRRAAAL